MQCAVRHPCGTWVLLPQGWLWLQTLPLSLEFTAKERSSFRSLQFRLLGMMSKSLQNFVTTGGREKEGRLAARDV